MKVSLNLSLSDRFVIGENFALSGGPRSETRQSAGDLGPICQARGRVISMKELLRAQNCFCRRARNLSYFLLVAVRCQFGNTVEIFWSLYDTTLDIFIQSFYD